MFAFATGCQAKNYLQDSVCSLAHFRANARPVGHTEADNAGNLSGPPACATETFLGAATVGGVENLAVCLSHSPSEIWPNIHFVFYPTVSGPKKRKRQSTADPDSEMTSSSDSDSSSTVDTSTSEGEDEKDFILPDYPSDELTSSKSSHSEPEEAPAENLSTGWSERVTRVDTQFHGDQVGPQNIPDHINHESTALSFLELFLDADFWGLLCRQTNLRAEQVKHPKPNFILPQEV